MAAAIVELRGDNSIGNEQRQRVSNTRRDVKTKLDSTFDEQVVTTDHDRYRDFAVFTELP